MTEKLKYIFYPKSKLVERIEKLEKDVESLKHSHKVLRSELENLKNYNKEVLDNINSIFYDKPSNKKNNGDSMEEAIKTQNEKFKEQANVFGWGD